MKDRVYSYAVSININRSIFVSESTHSLTAVLNKTNATAETWETRSPTHDAFITSAPLQQEQPLSTPHAAVFEAR